MLIGAAKAGDLNELRYPLIALPKLDGIRAYFRKGALYSRNHKPIPNKFIQSWAKIVWDEKPDVMEGIEGELIAPEPTAPHREVASLVRAFDTVKDFRFAPFDTCNPAYEFVKFRDRLLWLNLLDFGPRKYGLPWMVVESAAEAQKFFEDVSNLGYEGIMLRDPNGHYLRRSCTTKSQLLLKVKFFHDEEAVIYDVEEEIDKYGRPKARLGAIRARFSDGTEFRCGSGFTAEERQELWTASILGRTVTIKYQPTRVTGREVGEVPRFPIFKGFRDDGL